MNTWSPCAAGARPRWSARPCSTPCSPVRMTPLRPRRRSCAACCAPRERAARAAWLRSHYEVRVPGDKSISHRALILGALIRGRSYVGNLSPAADVAATARVLQDCGGSVRPFGDGRVSLDGAGAGVSLRSPDASRLRQLRHHHAADGRGARCARCRGDAVGGHLPAATTHGARGRAAARHGAEVRTDGGHAPVVVRGTATPLGLEHQLPVASAQVKSAILLAGLNAD